MDSSVDGTGWWPRTQAAGDGFHAQFRAYWHIVVYGRRRRYLSARYIRVLHARCASTWPEPSKCETFDRGP